ncbi:YceI family protein [Paludibaculum fermentans]|uniref:YceI family protein n=1 Tax=Paludibaculum fermentans TaxID=1473598 RepID=UPI003EBAFCBB
MNDLGNCLAILPLWSWGERNEYARPRIPIHGSLLGRGPVLSTRGDRYKNGFPAQALLEVQAPRHRMGIESKPRYRTRNSQLFTSSLDRPTRVDAICLDEYILTTSAACYSQLPSVDAPTPAAVRVRLNLPYSSDTTCKPRGSTLADGSSEVHMTSTNTLQQNAVSAWSLDPAHSAIHFKVRHMAIAWVRGDFRISNGSLRWSEDNTAETSIDIDIDAASVNSGEAQRDAHLRNSDFFDVEHYPLIHFRSTKVVRSSADAAVVEGELTIREVTRPVTLQVSDISKATNDPWGNVRFAASASAKINRKDFGLTWNVVLEAGSLMAGEEVSIDLDVEFTKKR